MVRGPLLITDDLARRLELAEAVDAAGCAEAQRRIDPDCNAEVKPVAGGVAVYCGSESPLTHALGIGMHGPVKPEELDELEGFFRDRGATVAIDLCPHADASFRDLLAERNYRILEFVNVMIRTLPPDSEPPAFENQQVLVRRAATAEDELYVRTVIGGFFGRDILSKEELRLGTTLFHMPCTDPYLAWIDGQPAGGGGVSTRNKVACLFGDATLPAFRGRGVHSALIRARIAAAVQAGCDLITAGTLPGSVSQHNYQKLGFQVAYTKATMVTE